MIAAAACSSFHATVTEEPDAAAPDGGVATTDSGPIEIPDAGSDAGPTIEAGAVEPLCPSPAGPSTIRPPNLLSTPPNDEIEYPFQMAADTAFVFWTAQHSVASDPDFHTAYDGHGASRIYRISKSNMDHVPDLLADGQSAVRAVAVDGDFLYWLTWSGSTNALQRVRRDCTAPCSVEHVKNGDVSIGSPVIRLLVPAPGVLVYITQDFSFYRVTPDEGTLPIGIIGPLQSAGFAATTDTLYVGLPDAGGPVDVIANVSSAITTTPHSTIAGITKQSAAFLASDCTSLFAYGSNNAIYATSLTGRNLMPWGDGGLNEVRDMGVDEQNVYVAQINTGGVIAFDRTTKAPTTLYPGNVWNLLVDNDGVYWGEHNNAPGAGGTIYWLKY